MYELDELLRAVGTNGVTEEVVHGIVTDFLAVRAKINAVLVNYREAYGLPVPSPKQTAPADTAPTEAEPTA